MHGEPYDAEAEAEAYWDAFDDVPGHEVLDLSVWLRRAHDAGREAGRRERDAELAAGWLPHADDRLNEIRSGLSDHGEYRLDNDLPVYQAALDLLDEVMRLSAEARERDDALRDLGRRWKRRTSGRGFQDAAREMLALLDREDT